MYRQLVAVGRSRNGFGRWAIVNTKVVTLIQADIGLQPEDAFLKVAVHHGQAGAHAGSVDRDLKAIGGTIAQLDIVASVNSLHDSGYPK